MLTKPLAPPSSPSPFPQPPIASIGRPHCFPIIPPYLTAFIPHSLHASVLKMATPQRISYWYEHANSWYNSEMERYGRCSHSLKLAIHFQLEKMFIYVAILNKPTFTLQLITNGQQILTIIPIIEISGWQINTNLKYLPNYLVLSSLHQKRKVYTSVLVPLILHSEDGF